MLEACIDMVDTYTKLLIVADLVALVVLRRYLTYGFMALMYGILMLMVWYWLYRLLRPLGFRICIAVAGVSAICLYLPHPFLRTLAEAVVAPSVLGAAKNLVGDEERLTA